MTEKKQGKKTKIAAAFEKVVAIINGEPVLLVAVQLKKEYLGPK